jgi:hypothetical protein
MDKPDWLLGLVIVPIYCDSETSLVIDVEMIL